MGTFENTEKEIISLMEDIARCYLLLNYSYNDNDENKLYSEEFKKRYINFYKYIVSLEEDIDYNHYKEIATELKKVFNINIYRSKMQFLDDLNLGKELEETNKDVDSKYSAKCSTFIIKLNFYHNNKCEFGSNTRKHVDLEKYEPIDCSINNEEEEIYLFNQMTDFFKNKYMDKESKKLILEDM